MEHPVITQIRRTGYAEKEPQPLTTDFFGNQIYEGDRVIDYDGDLFLWDDVSSDLTDYLKHIGASDYEIKK